MRTSGVVAVLVLAGTPACSLLLDWSPPKGLATDAGGVADAGSGGDAGTGSDGGSCAPGGVNLAVDPLNCGACGHACLAGECDGGECLPVQLVASANAWHLSVVPTNVFWSVNQVDGGIWRAALDGTGATEAVRGQSLPTAVIAAFGNLYWTATAGLWQDDITGDGGSTLLAAGAAKNIATDPGFLYWSGPVGGLGQMGLFRASPDSGQPFNVACTVGSLNQVVVDDTNAYWTQTNGTLSAVTKTALCGQVTLLADAGAAGAVAAWAGHVYFGVSPALDGGVWQVSGAGVMAPTPFAPGGTLVRMVADSQGLYWTEDPPGNVVWLPWDGGAARVVGQRNHPRDIATDGVALYWTETNDAGGIFKLAK